MHRGSRLNGFCEPSARSMARFAALDEAAHALAPLPMGSVHDQFAAQKDLFHATRQ
jgi:hypothetical protein